MSTSEQTFTCKRFKLRLPLAIEWVYVRMAQDGKAHTLSGVGLWQVE
jgi:hypothetical protein